VGEEEEERDDERVRCMQRPGGICLSALIGLIRVAGGTWVGWGEADFLMGLLLLIGLFLPIDRAT
jgi:hypothetical protein